MNLRMFGYLTIASAAWSSALADDFTISTKSYINKIDSKGLTTSQNAMACIVKAGTGGEENPTAADAASGDFRLLSTVTYTTSCENDQVKVKLKNKKLDNGSEFVVFSTSGAWDPAPTESAAGKSAQVQFGVKGEPNVLGNCMMAATKSRECTWIWHKVSATFACKKGKPNLSVKLEGSAFPSHRTWVNDACDGELYQQSFDALWQCQSGATADPKKVKGAGTPARSCAKK
jgi:hypothetical protein